jgi:hypothetical protein
MLTAYTLSHRLRMEQDWRHGMYRASWWCKSPRRRRDRRIGQYGVVDHVARFDASDGRIGYGLHEHGFWGTFNKYGMTDPYCGAK